MKKIIYTLVVAVLLGSCSKSVKETDPLIAICPVPYNMEWLNAKKAEYGNCYCLTGFRQGIYKNQPVIEIYGYDPLCNGINMVYSMDGTVLFNSADKTKYTDYTNNVKEQQVIWTCSKGNG